MKCLPFPDLLSNFGAPGACLFHARNWQERGAFQLWRDASDYFLTNKVLNHNATFSRKNRYGFSKYGVPPNNVLLHVTVLPNSVLFGGTVPSNSVLFHRTVPPNSFPLTYFWLFFVPFKVYRSSQNLYMEIWILPFK